MLINIKKNVKNLFNVLSFDDLQRKDKAFETSKSSLEKVNVVLLNYPVQTYSFVLSQNDTLVSFL